MYLLISKLIKSKSRLFHSFLVRLCQISVSKKRAQPFCKLYTAPPKDYLEFAVKSLEDAKTNASRFCIYEHQCLHILDALIKVGRDAIAEFSLEDKASLCHRICKKNCVAILTEVKKLIDECCDVPNYGWLQAVVVLGDVTEHLWFLLKNFEFYTTLLMKNSHRRESLADQYMDETGSFGKPDSWMSTKAEFDRVALLGKAEDLLQSVNSSVQESELATYLVGRLGGKSQLLRVDYKELKRLPGQLGGGASAKVYKTSWLEKTFAEKVFQVGSQQDFEHEMSSLERLSHPNVVLMHCYATSERECSLILELMEMDLSGYMFLRRSYPNTSVQGTSPFNLHEALDIMIQVAEGMCYLRRKNIVHRDLKPKNILVSKVKSESVDEDQEGVRVKISDLGLSVVKELSTTYHITMNSGTSVWMAPELIEFNNHNEDRVRSPDSANSLKYPYACDVYSFGMVCYEVLTGQEPFSSHVGQRVALKHKIKDEHLRPVIPEGYPKALTSLIQNCWNSVPTQRPRIEGICKELKSQMCLLVTGQLNTGD